MTPSLPWYQIARKLFTALLASDTHILRPRVPHFVTVVCRAANVNRNNWIHQVFFIFSFARCASASRRVRFASLTFYIMFCIVRVRTQVFVHRLDRYSRSPLIRPKVFVAAMFAVNCVLTRSSRYGYRKYVCATGIAREYAPEFFRTTSFFKARRRAYCLNVRRAHDSGFNFQARKFCKNNLKFGFKHKRHL